MRLDVKFSSVLRMADLRDPSLLDLLGNMPRKIGNVIVLGL